MSTVASRVAHFATTERFELGEGPVWDPFRKQLLWIDITRGLVVTGRLESNGHVRVLDEVMIDSTVGAVAVAESGEWIVAGNQQLFTRRPDGQILAGPRLIAEGERRRLNDGKPDPGGSFVVGTLSLDPGSHREELMSLETNGDTRRIDDDLGQANGLAWSVDGQTLYNVDSDRRIVFKREYDSKSRAFGARSVHIEVADGVPDGLCTDAEGCLWVAIWGCGKVVRFSGDGQAIECVRVPAPHTTSVAFAGTSLDLLIITTARFGLTHEQLTEYPRSGSLFAFSPRVPGLALSPWNAESSHMAETWEYL